MYFWLCFLGNFVKSHVLALTSAQQTGDRTVVMVQPFSSAAEVGNGSFSAAHWGQARRWACRAIQMGAACILCGWLKLCLIKWKLWQLVFPQLSDSLNLHNTVLNFTACELCSTCTQVVWVQLDAERLVYMHVADTSAEIKLWWCGHYERGACNWGRQRQHLPEQLQYIALKTWQELLQKLTCSGFLTNEAGLSYTEWRTASHSCGKQGKLVAFNQKLWLSEMKRDHGY